MPDSHSRKVFISYRRSDSADVAGRMYDRLSAAFGKESIFKDVDSIPYGAEFENVIAQRIAACDYVIVVIGRYWESALEQDGSRRIDNPNDLVRLEVEQAIKQGKTIIPVTVAHATLPLSNSLPDAIRPLLKRNGVSVRPDPDFHTDMDRLIRAIQPLTGIGSSEGNERSSPESQPGSGKVAGDGFSSLFVLGYVAIVMAAHGIGWLIYLSSTANLGANGEFGTIVAMTATLAVSVAALQAVFLLSSGTTDFLSRIRLRRRLLPLIAFALTAAALLLSVFSLTAYAAREAGSIDWAGPVVGVASIIGWVGWVATMAVKSQRWTRQLFFETTAAQFLIGGLIACVASILLGMALPGSGLLAGLECALARGCAIEVMVFGAGIGGLCILHRMEKTGL